MFSYKEPTRREKLLEVARVKSNDLQGVEGLYWYDDDVVHGHSTIAANENQKDKYDNKVDILDEDVWIKKKQVPQEDNSCLLYGKSKFSISMKAEKNQVLFMTFFGRAGSGKSWAINECINNFIKQMDGDDYRVICISEKAEEEQFFHKSVKYVDPETPEFIESPIGLGDIKVLHEHYGKKIETLIVYDDIDALGKEAQKAVQDSLAKIVKVGRSMRVHVIASSHTISDGVKSKVYHDQSSSMIYFPSMNKVKVQECWAKRHKFKPSLISFLMKIPTRWIQVASDRDYVLTETSCFQLSALTDRYKK